MDDRELPQVAIFPPNEATPLDWRVVVTLPDGRSMTVLIPIPNEREDYFNEPGPFGLNLVTLGHYD